MVKGQPAERVGLTCCGISACSFLERSLPTVTAALDYSTGFLNIGVEVKNRLLVSDRKRCKKIPYTV